ncbi:MAG: response regulator transcription factor [Bacteroidaceae bacterium]|nr:response regulator transcription factor [Bacteroidaceae bacterium]
MRILIIEDEQSNADRLKRMLEGEHEIVGVCASNAEVKAFFANSTHNDVDLILSDIQLGDGLSFESLRTIPEAIPVIFTTAYDQYAVQAFRFNSLDYLLKPIDADELHAALEKVSSSKYQDSSSTTDAIAQLLESVKSQSIRYRERFLIPHRSDEYLIIPVSEVSHITIRDGVVRLCTLQGKYHTLNMTLEEVESQLDPQRFMRVNRQYIISAIAVQKLSTYFLGKMRIHMTAVPNEEIIVSKDKVATVKRWLDS